MLATAQSKPHPRPTVHEPHTYKEDLKEILPLIYLIACIAGAFILDGIFV